MYTCALVYQTPVPTFLTLIRVLLSFCSFTYLVTNTTDDLENLHADRKYYTREDNLERLEDLARDMSRQCIPVPYRKASYATLAKREHRKNIALFTLKANRVRPGILDTLDTSSSTVPPAGPAVIPSDSYYVSV